MPRRPEVLYDGAGEFDDRAATTCARPCPSCSGPCSFDPFAVVRRGTAIGWATSPSLAALQQLVLDAIELTTSEFDGKRVLRSAHDRQCSPWVAPLSCPACGQRCLAVVSYGETQPARWMLVFDGLVPLTAPTAEPMIDT
ncbi:MAG: hypothetical protein AB7L13_09025 [Acidimicrobiia bacterium]